VHRDFASDNVLITRQGHVKVIDLGFVAPTGTRFEERTGTPSYMAPEQIRGGELTPATDIYACGVILYELFTGKLPFGTGAQKPARATGPHEAQGGAFVLSHHLSTPARPPREIAPEVPAAIERIILRCLEKDPAARFQGAVSLTTALRKAEAARSNL
jgi:serine/threonine-protein kinase